MTTTTFILIISFFTNGLSAWALLSLTFPYILSIFSFLFFQIQQQYQLQICIHLLNTDSQTAYVFLLTGKRNKSYYLWVLRLIKRGLWVHLMKARWKGELPSFCLTGMIMLKCKTYFSRYFQAVIKIGGGSVPTFTAFGLSSLWGTKGVTKKRRMQKS